MRKLVSTGSPWEARVGYSRAVIERVLAGNGFTLADESILVEVEATAVRARP